MRKTLVANFSATGATENVAKTLASAVGGDLYEIEPAKPYTSADLNWNDKNSRSSREMDDPSARPEINGRIDDMGSYDVIFVGFPIWWYVASRIIDTFLESYGFSGKKIIPIATNAAPSA